MGIMNEYLFYNAVAIALESDYRAMVRLHEQHETWESAYAELRTHTTVPDPESAWGAMTANDIRLALSGDAAYPAPLAEISHPPLALYSKGTLEGDGLIPLAIVGTRRATPQGKDAAKGFARKLAENDFAIVSGLAFGIDCAAHEGCLEGGGDTIAVLANGLDSVYPSTNAPLAERILKNGGMLISEYPPGSPPLPYRFLERNRIVSGLSKGILVIECPAKSGACDRALRVRTEPRRVRHARPDHPSELFRVARAHPSRGGARDEAGRDFGGVRHRSNHDDDR